MIDRDLAELYGVETKRLNEAVKRNNKKNNFASTVFVVNHNTVYLQIE